MDSGKALRWITVELGPFVYSPAVYCPSGGGVSLQNLLSEIGGIMVFKWTIYMEACLEILTKGMRNGFFRNLFI
jgi:hypothetical protein